MKDKEKGDEYEENEDNVRSYKRRFYILLVFALSAFAQYCAWNAFGPIAGTVKEVFGWGNAEIALLASMDPITYLLTMLFFSWLMDVKGLRVSLVISVFLMFVGTGLRCATQNHDYALWTMTAGQFLNGLAGPVTQAAPSLLSSAWFPRKERTTATAVSLICGSLGIAFSFLIGPNIVGVINMDSFQTSFEFSNLSSNYSFLAHNLYLNKSLPLSETLYKDSVHYWSMDNLTQTLNHPSSDIQYIYDVKGHLKGNAINKVYHVPGQVNLALQTDGVSGYVNLGNFTNTCLGKPTLCNSGMTVSLWLKYKASDETRYFLGTSGSDKRQPGFVVYQDLHVNGTDHLAVSVRAGGKAWTLHVAAPSDTWMHMLFTWSPREGLIVYTNGTLAGSLKEFVRTSTLDNHFTLLTLGRANDQYRVSAATYDELAVWYQVLTEKEVKALYARTSGINFRSLTETIQAKQDLLKQREDEIMRLLYIEFGFVAVLFFCTLIYFPDRPPTPPSLSALAGREDFAAGFKQLLRHKQFWTLAMVYGVTTGIYSGWGAVLALNLEGFNIGQNQAGWIGFYATIAGIGAGFMLARFSDYFGGRMKTLLLFLFVCSSTAFLWFSLLCLRIIPFSEGSLYLSSIIGGFSISGTIPLFYELTVECTYPIAEGVTTGVLTLINNIWTVVFLLAVMIPGIGTIWMNWCLFAACAGCIPILLCFKERYGRLGVDKGIEVKVTDADGKFKEERFKSKTIFASTLSMAGTESTELEENDEKSKTIFASILSMAGKESTELEENDEKSWEGTEEKAETAKEEEPMGQENRRGAKRKKAEKEPEEESLKDVVDESTGTKNEDDLQETEQKETVEEEEPQHAKGQRNRREAKRKSVDEKKPEEESPKEVVEESSQESIKPEANDENSQEAEQQETAKEELTQPMDQESIREAMQNVEKEPDEESVKEAAEGGSQEESIKLEINDEYTQGIEQKNRLVQLSHKA